MSLAILFHFLCAQHVLDITISIIRSLHQFCASACNTDTTQTQQHQISNTKRTENTTTDVFIQQQSRKLLMMVILMSKTCWAHKKWNKIDSDIKLVFYSSTSLQHCETVQANYVGLSGFRGFVYKNLNVKWIYCPWKLFSFRSVYFLVKTWELSEPIVLK